MSEASAERPVIGGVEAGGTKFRFGVASEAGSIRAAGTIATTSPAETIPPILRFFREWNVSALGVASFGPVEADPASPRYGRITSTPKTAWRDTDLAGAFGNALGVPVGFDTDVNGAAIGEAAFGAGRGVSPLVYVTVGTGIGAGALIGGIPHRGLAHPEMGHIPVRRHRHDSFAGSCPFHGDCLEGLASGPAIEARAGRPAAMVPPSDPIFDLEVFYLAQLVVTLVCILSPRRVILGGGVMHTPRLRERVRVETAALLNGYVERPELAPDHDGFIVAPGLGDDAGLIGAFEIARALANRRGGAPSAR